MKNINQFDWKGTGMEFFVLVGRRKQQYEGQYSIEALAVIDDVGNCDNPDYMRGEHAKYTASGEFDALAVVRLGASEELVREVLYPNAKTIPATVAAAA